MELGDYIDILFFFWLMYLTHRTTIQNSRLDRNDSRISNLRFNSKHYGKS